MVALINLQEVFSLILGSCNFFIETKNILRQRTIIKSNKKFKSRVLD
jgi:hypothetical protein